MNLSPAEQAWETPVPLLRASLPPFPLSAFPFKLEQFARGLSTSTETPPDLAGSLVLACVAASVSRKAVVSPKADYREPLNLMLLVVLPPGERKSSVFGRVLAPLERREARLRDRARPEIARALEAREALKREIADLERRVRKSKERESVERLEAARATLAQMPIPSLPRLLADDTTPEAIPQLIADNDGRLCIASAEGGIFTTLRGRYSSGAVNIDTFLKGHAGDTLRVDRRNAEAIIVESPALSAALAVQPTVLTELVSQKEFRGRGLVARFLLSVPSPRVGTRTFDAPDLPESIGHEYDDTIQRLLDLPVTPQPLVLQLQPEGFRGWRAFALEVEHGCREDGELVGLRDWVAKLPGAVLRIAGLIHICERVSDLDRIQDADHVADRGAGGGDRTLLPCARARRTRRRGA